MKYSEGKLGRIFVIRLHDGERIPDVLESFAFQKSIFNALCFFLGGVKEKGKVVVGPRNGNEIPPEPMVKLLEGVHEVCGIGTIFMSECGKPKLHMHASFGRENKAITGCTRMGIEVWEIGEVIMLEILDANAYRKKDKKTGFELLEIDK
ncbi:MAG: DNA-binding protein [Candidatus Bathyarchaeia archaeon]